MNFNDLRYFVTLINTKSFSETAEVFFISQPSISQSLKRLEESLGTKLIKRGKAHEKLKPTKTGDILYKNAQEIIQKVNSTESEIKSFINNDITLGIPPIIGRIIRPYIIEHLNFYGSKLKIVEEAGSSTLLNKMLSHDIPIAILGSKDKIHNSAGLEFTLLADLDMYMMISKKNRLSKVKKLSPENLKNENFISLSQGYMQEQILRSWINDNNISFKSIITTKEIGTAESLVESNAGIGLFIKPLISDDKSIEVIPLANPPKFYIYVIINKEMTLTTHQKKFNDDLIKLLKDFYKEISPRIK